MAPQQHFLLLLLLAAPLAAAAPLPTVKALNVSSYLGRWLLMDTSLSTQVFQSRTCVEANYSLAPDGSIVVLNSDRPAGVGGPLRTIVGAATQPDAIGAPGKLEVSFPSAGGMRGEYWVVGLGDAVCSGGSAQYPWAIVTDSRSFTLFVLARDPAAYESKYRAEARARLDELGDFDRIWNRPLPVTQEGCPPGPGGAAAV